MISHSEEVRRIRREVIARREKGEGYMQIARALGVTKGVVAGHWFRHRRALRSPRVQILGGYESLHTKKAEGE